MDKQDSNSYLSFIEKVEHLRHSLSNVQETIRFLDAKAAGCIAFVAIILGFTLSRPVLVEQLKELSFPCFRWWLLWGLFVFLVLSFIAVLTFIALAQWARKGEGKEDELTLLFPIKPKDLGGKHLIRELAGKVEKLTDSDVISEYCSQLAINGTIMTVKLKWCKWAFRAVLTFTVIALALGTASLLMILQDGIK